MVYDLWWTQRRIKSNKKGRCCLLLSDVRLTMVSYCRAVLTDVLAYVVSMPCGGDWYFLWSFLPCSVSLSSSLWKRKKKHINKKNKRTRIRIIGEYIAAHQQKERRERRKRQRDARDRETLSLIVVSFLVLFFSSFLFDDLISNLLCFFYTFMI